MKHCTKKRRMSRETHPDWNKKVIGWRGICDNRSCGGKCRRCQKARNQ